MGRGGQAMAKWDERDNLSVPRQHRRFEIKGIR
jgi:hypothetical protein